MLDSIVVLRLKLVMATTDLLMMTSFRIDGEPDLILAAAERCLQRFGDIVKHGKFSVAASIDHPDGLSVRVKCKLFYVDVLLLEVCALVLDVGGLVIGSV